MWKLLCLQKNGITDACSTADCCPLMSIVVHCCPLLPIATQLLPTVVHCRPLLPIVLHCSPVLPIVAHCFLLFPIVAHCCQPPHRPAMIYFAYFKSTCGSNIKGKYIDSTLCAAIRDPCAAIRLYRLYKTKIRLD